MKEAKLKQTFEDIFSDNQELSYSDLIPLVKLHFAVHERQAGNKIAYAKEIGVIKVQGDKYTLS